MWLYEAYIVAFSTELLFSPPAKGCFGSLGPFLMSTSLRECPDSLRSSPTLSALLHLFNLVSVHFEPLPWKTWHNTIYFYLNCFSGHVWKVHYSWIIHGHYWRSVQISFIGHPGECSRVACTYKLDGIISWKAVLLCLLGEKMTVSWNCREQSCFWKGSQSHFIWHWMHVAQQNPFVQVWFTWFWNLFRHRLGSKPCGILIGDL